MNKDLVCDEAYARVKERKASNITVQGLLEKNPLLKFYSEACHMNIIFQQDHGPCGPVG